MGAAVFHVMILSLLVAVGLGLAAGQDAYSCPDGWEKGEDRSGCRCFLIGESEAVMRSTADLICAGHSGSWVAELDHPGINYWLKARLLEAIPPGQYAAFWLGGRATGRHSEHQPGEWRWDHMNTTIEWFEVGWSAGQLRAPRDVSHTLGTARPVLPHCAGLQVERHELRRSRSLHLRDAMRCSLKNLIVFSL